HQGPQGRHLTGAHRATHCATTRSAPALGPSASRPPRVEPGERLVAPERALLEAQLEQVFERLADGAARADAEVRHHLVAVEVGADAVDLLLAAQRGDALLELVHPP